MKNEPDCDDTELPDLSTFNIGSFVYRLSEEEVDQLKWLRDFISVNMDDEQPAIGPYHHKY